MDSSSLNVFVPSKRKCTFHGRVRLAVARRRRGEGEWLMAVGCFLLL
ncbi:hypothetical protein MA6G0125S_5444 [Mycobacteroides abscessus 6G-0125-S]|nr:hypothetical protein MA6G0125S_5444 [Mycobacteroides abscessus 6G-0125-S]EIU64172.1 hypothetical protein MA6G0728S_5289 [Mycobacteroides abscessus 6G-0728-S]